MKEFLKLTAEAGALAGSLELSGAGESDILRHLRAAQSIAIAQDYMRAQKTINFAEGLVIAKEAA